MPLNNRQIAQVAHEAIRAYEEARGADGFARWGDMHRVYQDNFEQLVDYMRVVGNLDGPAGTWHAMLRLSLCHCTGTFDEVHESYQEHVFIARGVVTALTGWIEPRQDPVLPAIHQMRDALKW